MNTLVKCVLCLSLGLSACAAPRTNTHSGKVTPKGHVKVGFDMAPNLPVNTIEVAGATAVSEFNSVTGMQENTLEEDALYDYSKLLVAQAVDPLASGLTLYGRYGVAEHLDLGFGYSSGTLVYDVAYQFMGSSEPIGSREVESGAETEQPKRGGLHGAVGLQYSSQEYELPSVAGEAQKFLNFKFERKDILLRTTFSKGFGPEEKYGAFGFGFALDYAMMDYGFEPTGVQVIDELQTTELGGVPEREEAFLSYGPFVNLKVGWQYIYFVTSLSIYLQDYGTYDVFEGRTVAFDGTCLTFVPSFGLQGAF